MLYSPASPRAEMDMSLFWSVVLLLALGLVMVYSASIAMSEAEKMTGYRMHYFLMRHAIYLVLAAITAFIAFQIPIALWQKFAPALFIIGGFLLVIVLIPGVGREVNGSRRWISFGFTTMQPSELMKFFAVLYAADYTVRKAAFMHDFKKGFLPMLSVMVFIGAVLLREPDFGALVVITSIAMAILFLGGLNWRVFAGLIALLAAAFVVLIISSPYRLQRIVGFMDPWADAYGKGYQLSHSLIAFGRGEWLGVGLGGSVEKLFYLPEAHTDFLFAVLAEELGLAGVLLTLTLFVLLVWRSLWIARLAADAGLKFQASLAAAFGLWVGIQALINIGVNMGVLPTKGLTLPLMSYGRSSLIVALAWVGLLLRVYHEAAIQGRGAASQRDATTRRVARGDAAGALA